VVYKRRPGLRCLRLQRFGLELRHEARAAPARVRDRSDSVSMRRAWPLARQTLENEGNRGKRGRMRTPSRQSERDLAALWAACRAVSNSRAVSATTGAP
jgi:hypothetical protein